MIMKRGGDEKLTTRAWCSSWKRPVSNKRSTTSADSFPPSRMCEDCLQEYVLESRFSQNHYLGQNYDNVNWYHHHHHLGLSVSVILLLISFIFIIIIIKKTITMAISNLDLGDPGPWVGSGLNSPWWEKYEIPFETKLSVKFRWIFCNHTTSEWRKG